MLGGADSPDNLVLLCAECHWDAPDVSDPSYMLEWMEARESRMVRADMVLKEMIGRAGLSEVYSELAESHGDLVMKSFNELLKSDAWVGFHGSHVSLATMAATTIEAIRRTQVALEAGDLA